MPRERLFRISNYCLNYGCVKWMKLALYAEHLQKLLFWHLLSYSAPDSFLICQCIRKCAVRANSVRPLLKESKVEAKLMAEALNCFVWPPELAVIKWEVNKRVSGCLTLTCFKEGKTNLNPLTCWGKKEKQNVSLPQSQKQRDVTWF